MLHQHEPNPNPVQPLRAETGIATAVVDRNRAPEKIAPLRPVVQKADVTRAKVNDRNVVAAIMVEAVAATIAVTKASVVRRSVKIKHVVKVNNDVDLVMA